MLLLSRRENETIMIGDDVQIKLVMIDESTALIGITAPRDIKVHRQEVYDRNKTILKQTKVKRSKFYIREINDHV